MMQKRTLYSLLLTSFILVCAFSLASAQNTVVVQDKTVARCLGSSTDIIVNNAADISAFEIVLEIASTSNALELDTWDVVWDPGLTVLNERVIIKIDNPAGTPDTVRLAGMLVDAADNCLGAGSTVVAQLTFTTSDTCSGTVEVTGADYACDPPSTVTATTQFVDCATTTLVPAAVTSGTITVQNQAPTIDPVADATIHWGDIFLGQLSGHDPDSTGGCEDVSFGLVSGPAGFTVNPNGSMVWPTNGSHVCDHQVIVEIVDKCGASAPDTFNICVQNTPPTLTCPTDTVRILWGETASGMVVGNDPDGGPGALQYSVVSFSGPGAPTIDPGSGAWEWPTLEDNNYIGFFTLCLSVNDGANICDPCSPENADTCCVSILVIPTIRAHIEKTHNTLQGQFEEVSIYLDSTIQPPLEMGGFDFLISYDATALTFTGAEPGQLLLDCGWEYFTFRYGPNGNCGPNACPSGVLRVVAMAETNNGANHPDCFSGTAGQLVKLTFLVTDDRTFECQYVPIKWIWYDCGDNGISSVTGDTLFISRHVYDFDNPVPIEDPLENFPTVFGAPDDCDVSDKYEPLRAIDFFNGGIDIVCGDSIDDRGDLNLNGLAYEIADAVLYTNYFVYGASVLQPNYDARVAASDVNADGLTLSVGDLVYLVRVIVGDALPYPKVVTPTSVSLSNARGVLSIDGSVPMGAAFVIAQGRVTPELLADEMELKYAYDAENDVTRILVYSLDRGSFTGEFLHVPGDVVSIDMATYQGLPVTAKMVPTSFALHQNYPNPFNPTTTIAFALPQAADYSLTIYNVNGQQVDQFTGSAEAGVVELVWDASSRASGIYFYQLEAAGFSQVKKMILVK